MANIVITKTATKIKIAYNAIGGWLERNINRKCMVSCDVLTADDCAGLKMSDGELINLDYNDVDSVDGADPPTDNTELADQISDLIL